MADLASNISPDSLSELTHLTHLLHLFHHRNKNQHRHSIWWRHFSLFRKQLSHLTSSLTALQSTPTTNLARAKKKIDDAKILTITQKRLEFWREVMVPKWHYAFGQLIADVRFSVLGLVLMAVLGQVCGIVGITNELEELAQVEVERVLEEFGREEWGKEGEDVGEVVQRVDEETPLLPAIPEVQSKLESQVPTKPVKRKLDVSQKPPKKKRKKISSNAIDDIFG